MSDFDGWEIFEDELEFTAESEQLDFFQFEKPVSDLKDYEWATIRSIAMECMKSDMFGRDQFKCAIEAYHRWIALNACNDQLPEEFKGLRPKTMH